MHARFASTPNTGTTVCLNVLKVWCSRKATIATTHVSMYSMNVPKLLTNVTTSRLFGSFVAIVALGSIQAGYQMLAFWTSVNAAEGSAAVGEHRYIDTP